MGKSNGGGDESARVTPRGLDPELAGIVDLDSLNPDMHYRFVHERPQRISRLKAKGYRMVSASGDGVKTLLEEEAADDKIRDGDAILMCIPKERFQEGRRKIAKVTRGRLAAPVAQFRKKAQGAGPGGVDVGITTDKE